MSWLALDVLRVDPRYQRAITASGVVRINRIVREFRWAKFQPLTVAKVSTGKVGDAYAVIDGQHRLEAARRHPAIDRVPCYVVSADQVADQAKAFVAVNKDRAAIGSVNLFWARLAAGDHEAARILAVCQSAGVTIARVRAPALPPKTTVAVEACRTVLPHGDKVLRLALATIAEAWPEEESVFGNVLILALGGFFALYGDKADPARVAAVLADVDLETLTDQARAYRKAVGGGLHVAMRAVLTRAYNKGLSANRLAEPQP